MNMKEELEKLAQDLGDLSREFEAIALNAKFTYIDACKMKELISFTMQKSGQVYRLLREGGSV